MEWWEWKWVDFIIFKIFMPTLIFGTLGAFFIGIPLAIYSCYEEAKRPSFELKKDDWFCKEYIRVLVGKTYQDRCIQWKRK